MPTMHIIIVHLQVYSGKFEHVGKFLNFNNWDRIWEKGPIGNVFTNVIAEKLPFQMLQTILKYS